MLLRTHDEIADASAHTPADLLGLNEEAERLKDEFENLRQICLEQGLPPRRGH